MAKARGLNRRIGVIAAGGAVLAASLALAAGCVSEPVRKGKTSASQPRTPARQPAASTPRRTAAQTAARPLKPGEPPSPADECAGRLHDLSGLLLQYYLLNRRLPDRLEELAPLADAGTDVDLTCTASGQPYVYTPGGRGAPGTDRLLVIYDPTPAHNGYRWAVTMVPPVPGQALATWVVPFSEAALAAHTLPGIEPPPPTEGAAPDAPAE